MRYPLSVVAGTLVAMAVMLVMLVLSGCKESKDIVPSPLPTDAPITVQVQ